MSERFEIWGINPAGKLKLRVNANSTKRNHAAMKALIFTSIEELEALVQEAKRQQTNVKEAMEKVYQS